MEKSIKRKVVFTSITPNLAKQKIYSCKSYVGVSMLNGFFWDNKSKLFWSWIEKKFPECLVIIGDYLDRHNQSIFNNLFGEDAIQKSLARGFLMENQIKENEIFNSPKFKVIRWYDAFSKESVAQEIVILEELYSSCNLFTQSVDSSIYSFLTHHKNQIKTSYEEAFFLSLKYILEEMAVFTTLIRNDYRVQIYPGTQLEILKLFANKKIKPGHPLEEGIYLDVKLKRIK